jgi:hypothetical protein
MTPDRSEAGLREYLQWYLRSLGLMPGSLRVPEMVAAVLGFYRDVRLAGLADVDGDMLLYQWGTFDFGQGLSFRLDITRQFIAVGSGSDDGEMSQLQCVAHFVPADALSAIPVNNRWCHSLAEVPEFETYITRSAAFSAVKGMTPSRLQLDWGPV